MIVFDLKCSSGHVFEGWFASGDDYEYQRASGLLLCPVCNAADVSKAVMAPAVTAKSNQKPDMPPGIRKKDENMPVHSAAGKGGVPVPVPAAGPSSPPDAGHNIQMMQLMRAMAQAQAEALKNSKWVGDRFADQARAMHYGEEDHHPIHGEVDAREARDLLEEGVDVAPLLFPVAPPESRN